MRILISGSSGFIGAALVPQLAADGHRITRLVRSESPAGAGTVRWDPGAGRLNPADLEGLDAVVHLAGESIVGRWTAQKKARIRDSRVHGTRWLCEALATLANPPRVVVCASAIGYYGDRGEEPLHEGSSPGTGFLAEVCRAWEGASEPAASRGVRVVNLRIGVVLARGGGALAKMLPPFQLGLGGVLGSGRQVWSWVALEDVIGAIRHALGTDTVRGPVNAVAPHPVTNQEFTRVLGRVLRRPALFPVPAFGAKLLLGEMAQELLLSGARVEPRRLLETGYVFRCPELEPALRSLLSKTRT